MSEKLQIALIAGLLSGGFALLGAMVNDWNARRRERQRFRTETALDLAELERLIWGDNWTDLNLHLERQETRLAIVGISQDLIKALREVSVRCWRDLQESIELSGGEQPGINTAFLDARRATNRAVGAYLLKRETRSARQKLERQAVEEVERVLNDPDNDRIPRRR